MTNKKAEEVIARLTKEADENWKTIRILGDEENNVNAFSILLHSGQGFNSTAKHEYHGINKKTIALLKEANIEFEIVN